MQISIESNDVHLLIVTSDNDSLVRGLLSLQGGIVWGVKRYADALLRRPCPISWAQSSAAKVAKWDRPSARRSPILATNRGLQTRAEAHEARALGARGSPTSFYR